MKLLEFEEGEEKFAPIDFDDDDNCDKTDLFCEEDDEEDYDLCSSFHQNPFDPLISISQFLYYFDIFVIKAFKENFELDKF